METWKHCTSSVLELSNGEVGGWARFFIIWVYILTKIVGLEGWGGGFNPPINSNPGQHCATHFCPCCGVRQLSILTVCFYCFELHSRITEAVGTFEWQEGVHGNVRLASTTVPREHVSSRLEAKAWLAIDPFRALLNRGFRIQNIVILYHSLLVAL